MRPRCASGLLLFALAMVFGSATPARAWTRTLVKSAQATVEAQPDATMEVLLRLDVEVHAGWLHELELVGLGNELELDRYRPPYFRSEEGELFRPEYEVHEDGRVHLSFHRRDAPRRGEYRVFMRYRTKADVRAIEVEGERKARIAWQIPAWETGLHNVSVEIRAPKGASLPAEMQDTPPGVEVELRERPNRTVVEWQRIHLPRMTDWKLLLDVPANAIELPVAAPEAPRPEGFRPLELPEPRPIAWALFAVAVLALLKRRSVESQMGRDQLLVRVPWGAALGVSALALALGQWFSPDYLLCAAPLLALALHRPLRPAAPSELPQWQAVASKQLPAAAAPLSEWLDATRLTGLCALLGIGAVFLIAGQASEALFLLPIFLTGTARHARPTSSESAEMLRSFAGALRLPADAPPLAFHWERSTDGRARLAAQLPSHRAGLLRLRFVAASRSLGFLQRREVMLLVETRAQSDADDLLRRRTGTQPGVRASDGAVTRLIQWDAEAVQLLRVLAHRAPKPAKASRGTWLLREISEPGRKAA